MDQPKIEFRDDILGLYRLYLEKVEFLNEDERAAFASYFSMLSASSYIIDDQDVRVTIPCSAVY